MDGSPSSVAPARSSSTSSAAPGALGATSAGSLAGTSTVPPVTTAPAVAGGRSAGVVATLVAPFGTAPPAAGSSTGAGGVAAWLGAVTVDDGTPTTVSAAAESPVCCARAPASNAGSPEGATGVAVDREAPVVAEATIGSCVACAAASATVGGSSASGRSWPVPAAGGAWDDGRSARNEVVALAGTLSAAVGEAAGSEVAVSAADAASSGELPDRV